MRLAFVCAALCSLSTSLHAQSVVAPSRERANERRADTAPGEERGCASSQRWLLLQVDGSLRLDPTRLMLALEQELQVRVARQLQGACAPDGVLLIARMSKGRYGVRFFPPRGDALQRELEIAESEGAYLGIALLAGNLVRNEAETLLPASPPPPQATVTAKSPSTTSAPKAASPRKATAQSSFRAALLAGSTPRIDGSERAFVASELSWRAAGNMPISFEQAISIFEADHGFRDVLRVRGDTSVELHASVYGDLSVFAQLGLSLAIGTVQQSSGLAVRFGAGARYFVLPALSVSLESRLYMVRAGHWSAGGSSLPSGSLPLLGALQIGWHL